MQKHNRNDKKHQRQRMHDYEQAEQTLARLHQVSLGLSQEPIGIQPSKRQLVNLAECEYIRFCTHRKKHGLAASRFM